MRTALSNGAYVLMQGRMWAQDYESNGYGSTGFNQTNGGFIDGNGNYIWVNPKDPNGGWDSAIRTTGGTIKNLNIMSAWRGIFVTSGENASKVILENVVVNAGDAVNFAISCDQGSGNGLEANNCKFYTFFSYAATIGDVKFTNCEFGANTKYVGNNYCNIYAPTELVGCEFKQGYTVNAIGTCSFENCTLNGVALTESNIKDLVGDDLTNVTVK